MKSFFLVVLLFLVDFLSAQEYPRSDVEKKVRSVANAIVGQTTFAVRDEQTGKKYTSPQEVPVSAKLLLDSPYNDWRYWNGVLNIALFRLAEILNDTSYRVYALRNIRFGFEWAPYFQAPYRGENKWSYPLGQFFTMEELDDCGAMGASVLEAYRFDPQPSYLEYVTKATKRITQIQTRLDDGTFARSFPVRWTVWADDLYMSLSFLSRMADFSRNEKYFNDAAFQVQRYHDLLMTDAGIMVHNWYSDNEQKGVAHWGRANGWALLAQIDLLERIPNNHPSRSVLLRLLQQHLLGIARYQSASGLWKQLLDKPDSYEETSCSAMVTYAFAKAVVLGILPERYASVALRGWEGIASRIKDDGSVLGVCTGTVVSDNLVDYYTRPAPPNDLHGMGTIILAATAVLELQGKISRK